MNTEPLLIAIVPHFRLADVVANEAMLSGKLFDGDKLLFSYQRAADDSSPDITWGEGGESAVSLRFDELNIRELAAHVYGDADPAGLDLQLSTVFECLMDYFPPIVE